MNFDKKRYKVYTWKNWMTLHWMLNPGLAINELIFGQRVPKVSLEDKTVNKPRFERTLVPCPHCEALHDGRTWTTQNGTGFKNWFGLYCTQCGNIIPCLTNVLSFVILVLTFPIWGWFRKRLKAKWLEQQPGRFKNLDMEHVPNPFSQNNWIKSGLSWGLLMFLMASVIFPYFSDEAFTWKALLANLIIWGLGGLGFGYAMRLFMNKRANKEVQE